MPIRGNNGNQVREPGEQPVFFYKNMDPIALFIRHNHAQFWTYREQLYQRLSSGKRHGRSQQDYIWPKIRNFIDQYMNIRRMTGDHLEFGARGLEYAGQCPADHHILIHNKNTGYIHYIFHVLSYLS
jgi:hypothetical protein